jgi:CheY-like chemotaxis protein
MTVGTPQSPSRTTIAIVDDDQDIREGLASLLEDEGYSVLCFPNGLDALDHLRKNPTAASLIILDLMMPVMSGWTFCEEQARDARIAGIPVIIISANPYRPPPARAVLPKPLRAANLLNAVARHLRAA